MYKAKYEGKEIAVKEMQIHYTSIRELTILLKLNSPNLLRTTMYGIIWDSKNIFNSRITVAMELCDTDLHSILNEKMGKDTKWKVHIVKGTAQALHQLHQVPIIHNDIKPENFLIKNNVVKLTDFGLSDFGTVGCGGTGTPGFQAPEVIKSISTNSQYTNKSDVWSLGATLYEVLVGEPLFRRGLKEKDMLKPKPNWDDTFEKECVKDLIDACKELLFINPKERPTAAMFATKVLIMKLKK